MTPTLEAFYGWPIRLTVLSRGLSGDSYFREIVLHAGNRQRPVLYGAIRIFLNHFPPVAKDLVLEERFPLGHILQTQGIPHLSWPQAFFRAEPDAHMLQNLELKQAGALYGRRNVLLDGFRRLLADVTEVLGPVRVSEMEGVPTSPPKAKATNSIEKNNEH